MCVCFVRCADGEAASGRCGSAHQAVEVEGPNEQHTVRGVQTGGWMSTDPVHSQRSRNRCMFEESGVYVGGSCVAYELLKLLLCFNRKEGPHELTGLCF
eukprot:scaffold194571_cov21-Tisochrysis_lutea.AAC.1